jgi:hypothetical protein
LSMQCCLLDLYGRIKEVDSVCWMRMAVGPHKKLCWQLGSTITDFWPKFGWKPTLHDTTD